MACDFCNGEMTYISPYIELKREKNLPYEYTVSAKWKGCPKYADCSRNREQKTVFDFKYCPNCGEEME